MAKEITDKRNEDLGAKAEENLGSCHQITVYKDGYFGDDNFWETPLGFDCNPSLYKCPWSKDTIAIVSGGDISAPSVQQLGWTIGTLKKADIDIVGYFAGREIYCSRLGQFVYFPNSRYTPQEWKDEQGAE